MLLKTRHCPDEKSISHAIFERYLYYISLLWAWISNSMKVFVSVAEKGDTVTLLQAYVSTRRPKILMPWTFLKNVF